jgi:hypothetical protein
MKDSSSKFLGASGALAGALAIAVLALTSGEPSAENPSLETIVGYYGDHRTIELFAGFLFVPLIALFLFFFTGALRGVLRSGEAGESTWSTVVSVGLPLVAFSILMMGASGMAITKAVETGQLEIARTIYLATAYDWIPWAAPAAATMIATGVGAIKTATLPKSFAIFSIALGLIAISPLGIAGFLLMPLWLILASVFVLKAGAQTVA